MSPQSDPIETLVPAEVTRLLTAGKLRKQQTIPSRCREAPRCLAKPRRKHGWVECRLEGCQ